MPYDDWKALPKHVRGKMIALLEVAEYNGDNVFQYINKLPKTQQYLRDESITQKQFEQYRDSVLEQYLKQSNNQCNIS